MSVPQPPQPAKLVISLLMGDTTLADPVMTALEARYGAIEMCSLWLPFDFTRYYEAEMGTALQRLMLVFQALISQNALVDIKLYTNAIEAEYSVDDRRRINIDPGYLLQERFVLATGKNFSHRIYLDRGIYADLTLVHTRGGYQAQPWTYPDYASAEMRAFLAQVRRNYQIDLKQGARAPGMDPTS
ncbi:MAG: DUF4416 family protein [Desulfosarcinaceae bacterium]|nr:DUF4416 family protein [Desulfosarcinaceae bacterium]